MIVFNGRMELACQHCHNPGCEVVTCSFHTAILTIDIIYFERTQSAMIYTFSGQLVSSKSVFRPSVFQVYKHPASK